MWTDQVCDVLIYYTVHYMERHCSHLQALKSVVTIVIMCNFIIIVNWARVFIVFVNDSVNVITNQHIAMNEVLLAS